MNIDRIYSRNIVGAPRSSSLEEAAGLMRQYHVGALVVTDDAPCTDRAIGIVTDRDFVVRGLADGIAATLTIGELATGALFSIAEHADIHEAMETMRTEGVRRLLVTGDGGAIVGIVSLDDVVDALAAELSSLAGVIRGERDREIEESGEDFEPRRLVLS
jgi:CBS domain-containing protein